jgi:C4-dicarboxylate-specific signal transduction histidine kinase
VPKSNKRLQQRLRRRLDSARERRRLLSSIVGLGFWRWSRGSNEVWASKQARGILGLAPSAPVTREHLLGTIHPLDRAEAIRAISVAASHRDTVEVELRVIRADDQISWITARACVYRDLDESIVRVVGCIVDNTHRKRAEAESFNQQRQIAHLTRVAMLAELSGALAHELQQPLTAILCNAQAAQLLAAKADFNVDALREILGEIVLDDKHAGEIIRRLRSMLSRGELQVQRLKIIDILRSVLALCRGTLEERHVHVDLRIEAESPTVLGAGVELQQVLLNLILNASESMSGNGASDRRMEIALSHADERNMIRVSVVDCGKGIAEDHLERVFEPFFTTKTTGLGLGLAVSRTIIGAHKGRLWATNNRDRGAAFHFTLPMAESD